MDAVIIYEEMYKFIEKYYPDLTSIVALKLANSALVIMKSISTKQNFDSYRETYLKVTKILNAHYKKVIKLKEFPRNVKILLSAAKIHPMCYKLLVKQVSRR